MHRAINSHLTRRVVFTYRLVLGITNDLVIHLRWKKVTEVFNVVLYFTIRFREIKIQVADR